VLPWSYQTVSYYHRVLHKLRKERREGRSAPSLPNLIPSEAEVSHGPEPTAIGNAKPAELSPVIAEGDPGQVATITEGSEGPTMFKYRGKALLDRDWTEF